MSDYINTSNYELYFRPVIVSFIHFTLLLSFVIFRVNIIKRVRAICFF